VALTSAIALMTVIGVVAQRNIVAFRERAAWVEHSHQVLATAGDVLSLLKDAETGQRGYLLTGSPAFLEPYEDALPQLAERVSQLKKLTSDHSLQQQRSEALEALIAERLASLAANIQEKRQSPAPDPLRVAARMEQGKAVMDKSRERVAAIQGEERELLAQRSRDSQESAGFVVQVILFGGGVSVAMLFLGFSLLRREIAQRERAEQAIKGYADEIEDLYNKAPSGYHSLDADGMVARINDTELSWLGYTRDEVVGKPFSNLVSPETVEVFARGFAALKDLGTVSNLDFDLLRKDGSVLPVSLSATTMRDSDGNYAMSRSTLFDITERTRLEEERDRIFMLSKDLLCVAGFDGYLKRLNPAWELTLGHTLQELTASPFLDFVHPEDREATLAAFDRIVTTGAEVTSFENRYRCRDGSYRTLVWNSTPAPGEGVIYASAHDITERKRFEDALVAAKVATEVVNGELEAFSYSVSHDLRAPLRAIDGFSQALLEDCGERLDEKGKDYLGRVRAGAQRMAQLIDALLNLSRITRGQMRQERTDLAAFAREIAGELERSDAERAVDFRIAERAVAKGDPRLLRTALDNLLRNAWKYTSRRAEAVIEFGVSRQDGETVYFVRDNGIGFDLAHAGKLFGAFQRLHGRGEFEGTGIGLATVARIVRRHGGRIWAEAAVDRGATFFFTLSKGGKT